jgi:transposase
LAQCDQRFLAGSQRFLAVGQWFLAVLTKMEKMKKNVNKEEIEEIPTPKRQKSFKDRLDFLTDVADLGFELACRRHNIPERTAYRWCSMWDSELGISSLAKKKTGPPKGENVKFTSQILEFLQQQIESNNTLKGEELAEKIRDKFHVEVSKSAVNMHLQNLDFTYKKASQEDDARNSNRIIEERHCFAQKMKEEKLWPSLDNAIFWDESHFETNIIATKARSKRGTPATNRKPHRGQYIPKYKDPKRKRKTKKGSTIPKKNNTHISSENVLFTNDVPIISEGAKANSLSLCCAITGNKVLSAITQYRKFTAEDLVHFFHELLDKLERDYPKKGFTFIGDNEGIHKQVQDLFTQPRYAHHTYIPIPRYSPFLNAVEYLFNQLKLHTRGKEFATLGKLVDAVHHAFTYVHPEHLTNYYLTAKSYLTNSLNCEEIHSWQTKIEPDLKKNVPEEENNTSQKWDVRHRMLYKTEHLVWDKIITKSSVEHQPKPSTASMVICGKKRPIYSKE